MQKLICELCGSNDFTKDDEGFFVCDYCRTKYTVEQAKAMMVEGTVRVDRSADVASLLKLSSTALSGHNLQEAFNYANRALEIDPESSTAWYLKGTAAGWLSTVQVPRLRETIQAFPLAIRYSADSDRGSMIQWCADRTNEITAFLTRASLDHMRQFPAIGSWEAHLAICDDALLMLSNAYESHPNVASLRVIVSITSDLIAGVTAPVVAAGKVRTVVYEVPPTSRRSMQERLQWARSQLDRFPQSTDGVPGPALGLAVPPTWKISPREFADLEGRFRTQVELIVAADQMAPLNGLTRWELKNLIDYLSAGYDFAYALERTRPSGRR